MTTATARFPGLGRGMIAQLQRVNESPERLQQRIADQDLQIARLNRLVADLRAQLAASDSPPLARVTEGKAGGGVNLGEGFTHNNRPAAYVSAIAVAYGVNVSNVYRKLQKNKLAGAVVNGHWIVYTDQAISFKNHRRRIR